jgi:hypothetical protein
MQWHRQRYAAALTNWKLHSSAARANGRAFEQEVEELLKRKDKFTPEERVAVSRYFRSQHPESSHRSPWMRFGKGWSE